MKFYLFVPILFLSLFYACDEKEASSEFISGLKPVYVPAGNEDLILSQEPGAITKGSKIFIKDNYVFIVENGLGVHVIDNSNPSTPSDIRFLSISGVTDVAVRNNIMYANQQNDIVAINIQDVFNIAITERIENVYEFDLDKFPFGYSGYFECTDDAKGIVVAWEEAVLENPKCRR